MAIKVYEQVKEYFREHLPDYQVIDVKRKSHHPDDSHMWMVSAYHPKDDTYAFWSCYNSETDSLNHGHYGLQFESDLEDLFIEFYYDYEKESGDDC